MNSIERNQPTDLQAALKGLPPMPEALIGRVAARYRKNQHLAHAVRVQQLCQSIACLDLTSLSGDDSEKSIIALCKVARQSVEGAKVAAVCVYPLFVPVALRELVGTDVQIASVAAGFPTGLLPLSVRLSQIEYVVGAGANEVDVVAQRHLIVEENWEALYEDVLSMRQACGRSLLKVILETGSLANAASIARASAVCMAAGADFIKTSTGKETTGATLEAGVVMARAIQAHYQRTGYRVGLKPSGGIRSPQHALQWWHLASVELGDAWLNQRLFRFGASSLLSRLQQQLRILQENT